MNYKAITPTEKLVAATMARKAYRYVIVFDEVSLLPLYTRTMQNAIDVMRKDFKDLKNYRIMTIADFMKLEPKESYEEN